jgi:hypothetical protein
MASQTGKVLPPAIGREGALDRVVLAILLVVAFGLRFYRLEIPSLWWDEILTVMMAEFPLAYIAKWSLVHECHPPFFYYLIKLVLLAGSSDFAVRVLSAAVGTVSILVMYLAFARLFARRSALLCAAFLAVSPLHVRLSQEVRPYALLLLLGITSLYFFIRFLQNPDRQGMLWLTAANAGLLLLHFLTVPFVFAELALLPALSLAGLSRIRFRTILGLYALHGLAFLPALPFFFANFYHRPDMIGGTSISDVIFKIGRGLSTMLLTFYSRWPIDTAEPANLPVPLIQAGAALLLVGLGTWSLVRTNRVVAVGILGVLILPLICIALGGQGFFLPRHLVLLLPPLLLLLGLGAAKFLPSDTLSRIAALLLVTTSAAWIALGHPEDFYAETSHRGDYKYEAKALVSKLHQGDIILGGDALYALDWYVRRFTAESPLTRQSLAPTDRQAILRVLGGSLGHLAKNEEELVARFGPPLSRDTASSLSVLTFALVRQPEICISGLPFFTSESSDPERFYTKVAALKNVRINPFWGGLAIPTRNNQPCFFEYHFDNHAGDIHQHIDLVVKYTNKGPGNSIAVQYAFDDESPITGFETRDPAVPGTALIRIDRERPYRRLVVRFVLTCGLETPDYPGGNLATVGVSDLQAYFCPANDDAPCQMASMLKNLPQSFLETPLPGQRLLADNAFNVRSSLDESGWRVLSPADPAQPGVVQVETTGQAENAVIFPRACGSGASVAVYRGEDASGDPLFTLRNPSGECTPVSLQIPLHGLPSPSLLTFVLSGQNAQLWTRGDNALFLGMGLR